MCVVDVGARAYAAACIRHVDPGMVVQTKTDEVMAAQPPPAPGKKAVGIHGQLEQLGSARWRSKRAFRARESVMIARGSTAAASVTCVMRMVK